MDQSGSQNQASSGNNVTVTIKKDSDGYITVDKDPVHVKGNQTITWSYDNKDCEFTIAFPGECPFDKAVYRSSNYGATSSGPTPGLPTNTHKTYEYVVALDTGQAIDPGVVLH